jgi:hypothetical protein
MCRDMKAVVDVTYMPSATSTACAPHGVTAARVRVTLLEDGRLSKLFASGSVQPMPNR